MPPYRLMALDLDGTLLEPDGTLSTAHRAAVRAAQDQGLAVILATGRSWQGSRWIHAALGLHLPAITYLGAQVVAADGTVLWEERLPVSAARQAWSVAERLGLSFVVCPGPEAALATRRAPEFDLWDLWNPHTRIAGDLAPYLDAAPLMLAVYGRRGVESFQAALPSGLPGCQWDVHEPAPGQLVLSIWSRQAEKGLALARLCDQLQVPSDQVVAIGDSLVDLAMLRWSGKALVMAAAPPALQQMADWVAAADDPRPVASALRWLGYRVPTGDAP